MIEIFFQVGLGQNLGSSFSLIDIVFFKYNRLIDFRLLNGRHNIVIRVHVLIEETVRLGR